MKYLPRIGKGNAGFEYERRGDLGVDLCTSQLKPPPPRSRGRVGENRDIESLLNNKLSPGGGAFDCFRPRFPSPPRARVELGTSTSHGTSKMAEGERKVRNSGLNPRISCFYFTIHCN